MRRHVREALVDEMSQVFRKIRQRFMAEKKEPDELKLTKEKVPGVFLIRVA